MTITQLQYVLAVAEHKNFTLAAEKCFVTQPTLSMQIQKIEEEPSIESNLEALLDLALNENNFREAIRISYLLSIRNLNENHIITYTINKTNFEYVSEVGGHPAFPLFRDLTITFERIWFGDVFANESTFNSYRAKYIALNDIIVSDRKTQASE